MPTVPDAPEVAARCICGRCPSKPEELKGFYCARGKSTSTVLHRGCLCGECDVQIDYDLMTEYYCEVGAAV